MLEEMINGGIFNKPISDIVMHLKLEALLKENNKVPGNWHEVKARPILW